MIKIGKAEIENFLTIRKATFDFENQGLVAVLGRNGVGKSATVVESLMYPLFGITERFGRERDKIVNRFIGKNCNIKLPIKIDETSVLIDVYRKHQKFGNELFLWVNGEDKRGSTNEHTWEKIEKLLDMDAIGFQNSIVFGQSMAQYASLSDSKQKEIVERLMGCSWIPIAYKLCSDEHDDLSNKLSKLADSFDNVKDRLDETKKNLEEYSKKFEEFENQRKTKIVQLKSEIRNIESVESIKHNLKEICSEIYSNQHKLVEKQNIESKVQALNLNISELNIKTSSKISEIKKLIESSKTEELKNVKEIEFKIEQLENGIKGCETELSSKGIFEEKKLNLELKIKELEVTAKFKKEEIDSIDEKISNIKSLKISPNLRCGSCGQLITVANKKEFLNHLEEDKLVYEMAYNDICDNLRCTKLALLPILESYNNLLTVEKNLKSHISQLAQLKSDLHYLQIENSKIEEKNKVAEESKASIKTFEKELDKIIALKQKLIEEKDDFEDKLIEFKKVEDLIVNLTEQEKGLNNKLLENTKIETQNINIIKRIEEIEKEVNIYTELVIKLEREISELSDKSSSLIAEFKLGQKELEYKKFLVDFYSNKGFKSYLIESELPQMNRFADIYSKAMNGKYHITFSPQTVLKKGEVREKFNVEVVNNKGADVYDGNSSGEKRAIDSIIMFVLGDLAASRLNKRVSVLILDDIFEKLDEMICDSIIKILKIMVTPRSSRYEEHRELPERESIFVLTHLEYLKSQFENRKMIERDEDGYTEIKND